MASTPYPTKQNESRREGLKGHKILLILTKMKIKLEPSKKKFE